VADSSLKILIPVANEVRQASGLANIPSRIKSGLLVSFVASYAKEDKVN
jgi:hypothetical protein